MLVDYDYNIHFVTYFKTLEVRAVWQQYTVCGRVSMGRLTFLVGGVGGLHNACLDTPRDDLFVVLVSFAPSVIETARRSRDH